LPVLEVQDVGQYVCVQKPVDQCDAEQRELVGVRRERRVVEIAAVYSSRSLRRKAGVLEDDIANGGIAAGYFVDLDSFLNAAKACRERAGRPRPVKGMKDAV
jgi:hypothetical protein